ncbi:zinc finger protein 91 isoform X4 [Apis cerana]|uniref:zinc finger protein 91 isoform X4 n=1 Tax=Apis cerana TaxID=7461 RepID=UPI002B22FD02|nr:zinc finger protein 91 isoform X4 [Apis cerana]XP_061938269.1 zinc finger protein 91 isoform X4 [Apis cerana]XP_061938270.1 zinc finger protein 91 isoform X4 [Apis cerana]
MSGRLPRLRALRPRPQHFKTEPHKESNLKENRRETVMKEHDLQNEDISYSVKDDDTIKKHEHEMFDYSESSQNYECKTCKPSKSLSSLKAYLDHLKKEHKQKGKFMRDTGNRCSMCSYVALNSRDLETHQRVHHLKRRFFRCAKCSYVTHVRARYTKHVKYHSMPMIKCDACDFRTPYKWNLDRHTRNHGGGGAFQCRACNFTADIRQSLTVHETNHHEPPVGQINRKSSTPFERKPRNSPKRYNQVGASDFRESLHISASTTVSISPGDTFISDQIMEDKRSAIANAECIALKCEEKGCQFITAWDSEMQRHLAECHIPITPNKSRKPLPMLIPLSPAKLNNISTSGPSTTLLKVPRVRVRPELAQIARDTELAKLYGNKEANNLKKDANNAADLFEKKNASFFDKLKEKLTTTASINNGVAEVAVEQQSWEDQIMEERSVEEMNSDEPPTKLLIMNRNEYLQTSEPSSTSISIASANEGNHNLNTINIGLRPPPPLKAAVRNRGQSLLKNNLISPHAQTGSATVTDENKRTMWKCKRCNFRHSNRETVSIHVKSHNEFERHGDEKNAFGCEDCPFSASDAASLSMHRIHHRPNLEAIFKCYLCPYYVSTKAELLDHVRLHGEELAVVHQQTMDYNFSTKSKVHRALSNESNINRTKQEKPVEQVIHITTQNNVTCFTNASKNSGAPPPPPLLLDTRALPEAPLVWVSRPDGTLAKMLKCRHCPFVSSRRAEVRDHETMHLDSPSNGPVVACTDCSFTCTRREVMVAHTDMHSGSLGTVHCLVDDSRPDSQQLSDLAALLGFTHSPILGSEPDLRDLRLVHCCSKCPARFLCEKELRIHLRYHSTELAYSCQWCSYAARQPAHLLAHQKAHSTEYQERTKYLLSLYGHSQRYPPPTTACVETNNQDSSNSSSTVAWIVVEVTETSNNGFNNIANNTNQRTGNQVFTCAKCPARYFKLDALEYHMTLHGSNNRFKCTECDYSSKTAQNLVKHQVVHRRQNETNDLTSNLTPSPDPQFGLFMRGNPNFVYPGYLRNGRLKEKRYKCHKCPSAFEKREQYRVHLTLHGAKQRYRCDTCDYSVKYYANYIQHLKKHQANAEAQASRRQFEDDTITIDSDIVSDNTNSISRSGKTLKSSNNTTSIISTNGISMLNFGGAQASNQDKQSLMLLQKKGILLSSNNEVETLRCQNCPFSTCDKDTMDAHKRRHGIERMTPSCPHCDYIPRKDENVGEHIRLHFTRLYKPESYLIIELLTLTMRKITSSGKEEKQKAAELLFKEYADGRFFPFTDTNSFGNSSAMNYKEKVIVDPNTGETKHLTV